MQRVQTLTRLVAPSTTARTVCRFGSKRRGRTLWAWDTLRPTTGPLPQISHLIAITGTPQYRETLNSITAGGSEVLQAPSPAAASAGRPGPPGPDTRRLRPGYGRLRVSPRVPWREGRWPLPARR